jgi:ribosomal protein S18 acetylase RimI-like enzyme
MPDLVQRIDFTGELLSEFNDFHCGDEPWEVEVSTWIKSTDPDNSALADSAKWGTRVWVYLNGAGNVIGFGSLGLTDWTLNDDFLIHLTDHPPPQPLAKAKKKDREPVVIIPMVGLHRDFHGLPKGQEEVRYGKQVLLDLRAQAAVMGQDRRALVLSVNPDNKRAIHFYVNNKFRLIEPAMKDGYLRYGVPLHSGAWHQAEQTGTSGDTSFEQIRRNSAKSDSET